MRKHSERPALTAALVIAVTAPNDELARTVSAWANDIAANLSADDILGCKAEAQRLLDGDDPLGVSMFGRAGGRSLSPAKAAAARRNGRRGGRPKKKQAGGGD